MKIRVATAQDFDAAIKQLQDYAKRVEDAGKRVVHRLTEDGTKQAQELAMYMNAYDSGELVNGIVPEYGDSTGRIVSTAPHSAFVEFGTGVVGKGNPSALAAQFGWQYDVNEHGEAGWWYTGDDGKRHWTKGMPSRPFMYDTAQMLRQAVPEVVKDELSKEGG